MWKWGFFFWNYIFLNLYLSVFCELTLFINFLYVNCSFCLFFLKRKFAHSYIKKDPSSLAFWMILQIWNLFPSQLIIFHVFNWLNASCTASCFRYDLHSPPSTSFSQLIRKHNAQINIYQINVNSSIKPNKNFNTSMKSFWKPFIKFWIWFFYSKMKFHLKNFLLHASLLLTYDLK